MTDLTCITAECNEPRYAKGFCKKHYFADRYQRNIEAERAQRAKWRADNPDYLATYNRAYYKENSESLKANAKAWREANPDRKKASDADWVARNRAHKNALDRKRWHADPAASRAVHASWYARNKHKSKEAWHRRRARKFGVGYERVDLKKLLAEHGMVCHICSIPIPSRADLHFDHVIPLALGGPHNAANIRPAHARCNLSKGARLLTS